ncbi:MAG TPA: hypothetical protein ENH84_06850 [Phycisphaerae bacterium]|nr:hypothetical protein [Phycisphaerae bacterium]
MNYQTVLEMMRSRRSIRSFTDRKPSRTDIERLIEAARWAPSNHNRQGWKFIVFEDRRELQALADRVETSLSNRIEMAKRITSDQGEEMIHYATLFAKAPIVILVMHKRSVAVGRKLLGGAAHGELVSGEPLSAAMAVQNMLMAAHCLGLGTCVATAPLLAGEVWRELNDLPAGFDPTCIVAVGYSCKQPSAPRRKPLEQILEYR